MKKVNFKDVFYNITMVMAMLVFLHGVFSSQLVFVSVMFVLALLLLFIMDYVRDISITLRQVNSNVQLANLLTYKEKFEELEKANKEVNND